jgi:hypothetical protein
MPGDSRHQVFIGDYTNFKQTDFREEGNTLWLDMGVQPMAKALRQESTPVPLQSNAEIPDVEALKDENARLRELVIQLSELVIKNIVDDFGNDDD